MDEPVDNRSPDDFSLNREDVGNYDDHETGEASASHRCDIGWETYLRCFFLLVVMSLLGFLIWKQGLLRLNILASLVNPSRGESLAWKAENDPPLQPLEVKRSKPPQEWRLTPGLSANWHGNRPAAKAVDALTGSLSSVAWRRFSVNPWSWQDDVPTRRGRNEDAENFQPPQKPASSFRAGNIIAFPDPDPLLTSASTGSGGNSELSAPPMLPPLNRTDDSGSPMSFPALPSTPETESPGAGGLQLPPMAPLGAAPETLRPPSPVTQAPAMSPVPFAQSPIPATNEPSARAQPPAPAPTAQEIDWKNREIVGPIPDAYLTIYPKLKFIGLCVPGQGYIRKYNQIGVPADANQPKLQAQDGRTPYGRYYIADRNRDADGPRLYLSWPSPEDADRIGLSPNEKTAVETAWQRQSLPPQNTKAGGGIGLNGLRQWVETTEGGFTLEAPHMEEIFTALPDKAWVFIQP